MIVAGFELSDGFFSGLLEAGLGILAVLAVLLLGVFVLLAAIAAGATGAFRRKPPRAQPMPTRCKKGPLEDSLAPSEPPIAPYPATASSDIEVPEHIQESLERILAAQPKMDTRSDPT